MEVPEPIRALMAAWGDAYEAADAGALAALYLPDAQVMTPEGAATGRLAIAARFQARLAVSARDQPRLAPRKFFFFPPLVHAATTGTGRHGEKHSALDILVRQPDGAYLFACSSWTWR